MKEHERTNPRKTPIENEMKRFLLVTLLLVAPLSSYGQRGDKRNETQPEVWQTMDVPPAPALSPQDALKHFHLAPGFRIELVAAEPMIVNPVAIRFDEFNRLWVVEMTAYMPTADGKGEDARTGRVSVLEDTNFDGRMDKATVFLDELQMPRAVSLVKGGVLIAEPPILWYCKDTNGDLICDEKSNVAKYARQGPVEHTENGLVPGLDNWIYNAKSGRRFKFVDDSIIEEHTNSRGQWGIAQDNYGRLYYNSNSSYLHADILPWHYQQRNSHRKSKHGIGHRVVHTSKIFSARVNPGINRGYQKHMLSPDGRLARITAISGQTIYRGDQFGEEYVGDAFIPEPSANALTHFSIQDTGLDLKAEHHTYPHPTYDKVEFLTSTDERFRPVDAANGPDGSLYIVDLYHGILQHKVYVTSFLRKQIHERKLDTQNQKGRIYRIVREEGRPLQRKPIILGNARPDQQVAALAHPNGWIRDTAQRLLVQSGDTTMTSSIKKLVASENHLAQIHALWTLEGLKRIDGAQIAQALKTEHRQVRIAALRAGESAIKDRPSMVYSLLDEEDPAVVLQLMYTLGETSDLASMKDLLARHASDQRLRDAAISGLAGREATFMQLCVADPEWKDRETMTKLADIIAKQSSRSQTAKANLPPLTKDDQKLFDAGIHDYLINCAACHLPTGEGQPAVAPTLVKTTWVNGSAERLVRIVLNGLMGPIEIDGEDWDLLMPPHRDHPLLDDQKIAGVLTYVRRSWGNNAPPIKPKDVTRIREATRDRLAPWTVKELNTVE